MPITSVILDHVRVHRAGAASGVHNTLHQLAASLGVVAFGAIVTNQDSFLNGLRIGLIAAAVVLIAVPWRRRHCLNGNEAIRPHQTRRGCPVSMNRRCEPVRRHTRTPRQVKQPVDRAQWTTTSLGVHLMRNEYLFGDTDAEHRRLMLQARVMKSWTDRFLRSAGLTSGMSVLDVGSGLGDVSLLVHEIVGPGGHVLGIDHDVTAVKKARSRVASEGLENFISFQTVRIEEFDTTEKFDAVVGRLVLWSLTDRVGTLRRLSGFVRPGGIMAFHEVDMVNSKSSYPPCDLWDNCYPLIAKLFLATGHPDSCGPLIPRAFADAGLPWPTVDVVGTSGGLQGDPIFPWMGTLLQNIAPQLEEHSIEMPPGVQFDDRLSYTLEAAALMQGSQVYGPTNHGIWTRVPARQGRRRAPDSPWQPAIWRHKCAERRD